MLLFGAAGLFGKLVLLPPTLLVLGRVVFAAGALGLFLQWRDRTGHPRASEHLGPGFAAKRRWPFVGLGLLLAIHWVTFFHAIQLSTVAIGLLTFATFPIFTALLEPFLPGERFEPGTLAAAAVSLAGIAWVVAAPSWVDP